MLTEKKAIKFFGKVERTAIDLETALSLVDWSHGENRANEINIAMCRVEEAIKLLRASVSMARTGKG
jgi:hypothetical protein